MVTQSGHGGSIMSYNRSLATAADKLWVLTESPRAKRKNASRIRAVFTPAQAKSLIEAAETVLQL